MGPRVGQPSFPRAAHGIEFSMVRTVSAGQVRLPLHQSAVDRARPYLAMLGALLEVLGSDDRRRTTENRW
jgi:hypothetical protein